MFKEAYGTCIIKVCLVYRTFLGLLFLLRPPEGPSPQGTQCSLKCAKML